MTPRAAIQQLGRLVRDDIRSGELSSGANQVGEALAAQPDLLMMLVDVAAAETRKKRPDEHIFQAYAFMLGQALEQLRRRSESGQSFAGLVIDDVKTRVAARVGEGKLSSASAMILAAAIAQAGLDVGAAIREALNTPFDAAGLQDPDAAPPDIDAMLTGLVAACENDLFLIHSEVANMIAAMGPEPQLMFIGALAMSAEPALREAAVGWLLADVAIAKPLAQLLEGAARRGLVSSRSVAHLLTMRNWVGDEMRPAIDALVRTARAKPGVPYRRSSIQVKELLLSERDGAGAQSIYAVLREGRRYALASLLLKQGHGVREAWVARPLGRAEVDEMLDHVALEVGHHETSAEGVARLVAHGLSEGRNAGLPTPFGLVQLVELLGLDDVSPRQTSVDELVDLMLAELKHEGPAQAAVEAALRRSSRWRSVDPNVESWFENGDDAVAVLAGKRKRAEKTAAILDHVLPLRRRFWAEVIAWSAFARSDQDKAETAISMALVARELAGDRPLREIPITSVIAEQTVAALTL